MSKVLEEVLAANRAYAADFGDKGDLAMPPARQFAVLTCMDARLDPAKYGGLAEGDAHVIRNAGGRASDDAIRSLVISYKLLGTKEWFVIHHTNCGMETFTDEVIRGLLASSLDTSTVDESGWHDTGSGPGSTEGDYIDWLTISDNAKSVVADVRRIRSHPLVPKNIPIYGYISTTSVAAVWSRCRKPRKRERRHDFTAVAVNNRVSTSPTRRRHFDPTAPRHQRSFNWFARGGP